MPAIKTPSSSLPASPRVAYKPLDLDKIFQNLSNGGSHPLANGSNNQNSDGQPARTEQQCVNGKVMNGGPSSPPSKDAKELSSELAQLHALGAELRSGLLKAVDALRLVQSNDDAMRSTLESANAQTQKSISELTKVISAVQDDSNQLRTKFDQLEVSNKEMTQKMGELEKLCQGIMAASNSQQTAQTASQNQTPAAVSGLTVSVTTEAAVQGPSSEPTPGDTTPVGIGREKQQGLQQLQQQQSQQQPGQPFFHSSGSKLRQTFLTFLTSEVHFCRTMGKLCQQQQQTLTLLSRRNMGMGGPVSPTPTETIASVMPTSLWQVYRVHAEFLAQLESRMARWGHWGCLGDVFLRLLDNKSSHFGDIYKLYANELLSIFGAGGSPVCAPLLLPFRRLADYVAFLEGTRQGLDADHPDLYNVAKSTEKLRSLITRLNEQQLRFLLVADNVAPVGAGTALGAAAAAAIAGLHEVEAMTASCNGYATRNDARSSGKAQNGCATISRTRYTQNTKQNGNNGGEIGAKKASRLAAPSSNMMLKSRSHGDLYLAAHQQQQENFMAGHPYHNELQQPFMSSDDPASDEDDDDEDCDLSPNNYPELFEGDVHLTTRSLQRSRMTRAMKRNDPSQLMTVHHQRNLSDEGDQVVLDCWVSKPSGTMPSFVSTMSTASSSSRPCSASLVHPSNENGDLSIPPTPIRSCETSRCNRPNGTDKVSIFLPPGSANRGGTISSGSSGSGGSTSGKSYQPLESVKQSLLNLFNGYKKKKRGTIRGLMSPVSAANAPQIRIISPPTLVDKSPYSVLANSNLHVDIRNGAIENGRRNHAGSNLVPTTSASSSSTTTTATMSAAAYLTNLGPSSLGNNENLMLSNRKSPIITA